jgi:hypothetical protein
MKKSFARFLAPMKKAPRTLGRYFTHREPKMHVCNVLDFKLHIYRGFRAMISEISPALDFGAILLKAPVSLGFLQFRSRLGPHFKVDFLSLFGGDFP